MQGMELSSTLEEKAEFRVQTADIMDVATRIKNSTSWTPPATQVQAVVKNKGLAEWEEGVVSTRDSEPASETAICQPISSRIDQSSDTAPVKNVCTLPSRSLLIDLSEESKSSSSQGTPASMGTMTSISRSPVLETQPVFDKAAASYKSPSVVPFSQIHRLVEPRSTRKRSKREDIILLKASMVNGFKCPPWDKPPSSNEFLADQGIEMFW